MKRLLQPRVRAGLGALVLAGALAGCQTLDRPTFSRRDLAAAGPAFRYDSGSARAKDQFLADVHAASAAPQDGSFDMLALSAGVANGAFGAGVLVGWSERGDRPRFEVVTGVSIGALIAPFAFVGRERDGDLQAAFTDGRTERLLQANWANILVNPGLYRSEPLRKLISDAVDPALMQSVAEGHNEGRRLYVATTSLDTREQVIWDMGALAASGDPDARRRFIDILTAASSIPGAFAPVLIDVPGDGGPPVEELHADGRLTANFFVAPEAALSDLSPSGRLRLNAPGRIWVIINGSPVETFSPISDAGVSVAGRSLEAMLNASTRLSLIAAAQFARSNDLRFAATMVLLEDEDRPFDFSQARMIGLFDQGRQRAIMETAWNGERQTSDASRRAPPSARPVRKRPEIARVASATGAS